MSELGLVSVLMLAGMVMGVGSVFLSMWFLPVLLRRLDVVPAVIQTADQAITGQQNSRQNENNLTVAGKLTPDRAAVNRDVINEEIMAAIAATLCAYGITENESYRIKQVRVVN